MTQVVRGAARRPGWWPLFGLALLPLIAAAPAGAQGAISAAPALPSGGVVTAGSAAISVAGTSLTVTQGSARAIIDWNGFSVGAGGSARFDNGTGATLNRVTGASVSSIDGMLSASGSVYLINPNGVVIGTSGVVDVGGTFVASTLDIADGAFLNGGDLAFAGPSTAAVVNLGRVGALGGDVALIARTVTNAGTLGATNGTVGLLAGTEVLLRDAALDDGRFVVRAGGAGTSVTNSGTIQAAAAELRANGGNVYALAGDTAGVIRASGVTQKDGRIFLIAGDGGATEVAGSLVARGAGGAPGFIETSGGTVRIGAATVDAGVGGTWLVDPTDLTIDQTAANSIAGSLNAGTSVTQSTSAAGSGGGGDIIVNDNVDISWATNAALTLSAFRNIQIGFATITSTGGGAITLYADNTGTGGGTLLFRSSGAARLSTSGPLNLYYSSLSADPPRFAYTFSGGGTVTAYKLVNNATDLSNISANLSGAYALGRDIDGAGAGVIGGPRANYESARAFTGIFDGQGHSISNFRGSATSLYTTPYAGLFARLAAPAVVRNLNLINGTVSASVVASYVGGGGPGAVGGLAGANEGGTVQNVTSSVAVYGYGMNYVGGLIGVNFNGSISGSYANGPVTGDSTTVTYTGLKPGQSSTTVVNSVNTGGLVGGNGGAIVNSYATGRVDGSSSTNVGGLVGYNSGSINGAYASGAVIGSPRGVVGGLVAVNASNANGPGAAITDAYWDQTTTGQLLGYATNTGTITRLVGLGGGTGYSPYAQSSYTHFTFGSGGTWYMIDGGTRPILQSEYSTTITTAHQLQLMAMNLGANYVLGGDLDASETASGSGVWSGAGFVSVGDGSSAFTGSLDGQGRTISGLTINRSTTVAAFTGLFGITDRASSIRNLSLVGGAVTGAATLGGTSGGVGALAGYGQGTITNVSSSTPVTATGSNVGGLFGFSTATIAAARTTGAVTGGNNVGGLVGSGIGAITQSSASGAIVQTGSGSNNPVGFAGGLVGDILSGSVADSYATGSVTGSGATSYVGGLVGYIGPGPGGFDMPGSVTRSYSSGTVSGAIAGALVGGSYGTASNSYWDAGITTAPAVGRLFGGGTSSNLVAVGGSTGNSAYAASTYAALDLSASGPWALLDGSTRPILRSEYSTTVTGAHQLQLMALNPYVDYTLAADIDLSVTANPSEIWNPAVGFTPLGSATTPFTGALRGGGHTISNLTVARSGADNVGLFAGLGNTGTVTNLTLANVNVAGATNVGGLAGYSTGNVSGVTVSGTIAAANSAGGLVGYNLGAVGGTATMAATVTATNFAGGLVGYNAGTLSGTGAANVRATAAYAGGLAGYGDGRSSVSGSVVAGAVSASDYAGGLAGFNGSGAAGSVAAGVTVSATRGAAGLVAFNTGAVTNGSSAAAVTASDLGGGLVAVNFGTVSSSTASGAVSGGMQLGGLIGANVGGQTGGGVVTASSATSTVSGTGTLGGLAGYNDGTIIQSYATGTVGATGASFVGGLVGYNARTISASYATGAVTGATWVGGLAGYNDTQGRIANAGASGTVSGVDYAGGLAGFNGGAIDSSNASGAVSASNQGAGGVAGYHTGTITAAYATGAVSTPRLGGGLAGLSFGTVSRSFATGRVSGSGDSLGGLIGANAGPVSESYATGAVSGGTRVGGFAGSSSSAVNDVYATGAVTGSDAQGTGGLVGLLAGGGTIARGYASGALARGGGVAGTNDGTLSATFYDAGTTGAASAVASGPAAGTTAVGGTTGRSATAQGSYAGLNFLDTWTIREGQSRPYLQNNPQNPAPQ